VLAEQLVGEGRERRQTRMAPRERVLSYLFAGAFLLVALAIATFVPFEREVEPWLVGSLVIAYAVTARVRFEFGESYVSPEEIVFVAMLALVPLPLIPLLVAVAGVLAILPEVIERTWHRERWISPVGESWFSIGPVLVLAALAPGTPVLGDAGVYLLAFGAQLGCDLLSSLFRQRLLLDLPTREVLRSSVGTGRIDAVLAPASFVFAVVAVDEPAVLITLAPLVWMLHFFSRDRTARYSASLELNRAYRGTVMLLADVVEFDDTYTGDHSRSVGDLVRGVAEHMGIDPDARQELEFAALLHDVGKIGIPKEILNKPSSLSESEFEIMKTHTIEGQFMLDRVGGLLGRVGEIVRSCHERWDGNGYPDGLKGEGIPLASRIVFACDAFSAMTTDRPYRAAMSWLDAVEELRSNAGTQFDPRVIDAVTAVLPEFKPEVGAAAQIRSLLSANPTAARVPG
jgi:HD-GYP domain-containing protein (c-di-GMP phosphodiesterase class II)